MPKSHAEHSARESYDPLSFDESRFQQLVKEYGQPALYGLAALFVALAFLYFYQSSKSTEAQADFFKADAEMKRIQLATPLDLNDKDSPYNQLVAIMQRHPELHAKYDGLLAQALLLNNENILAKKYIDLALKRTNADKLPLYSDFSKITLLAADGHYTEALAESQSLKQKIQEQQATNPNSYDTLFAINSLRITLLQSLTGESSQKEILAIEEFKKEANLQPGQLAPSEAYAIVLKQLQDGTVNLINYIDERQKSLSQTN